MITAEEFLDAGLKKMIADHPDAAYISFEQMKAEPEYQMMLDVMHDYASQFQSHIPIQKDPGHYCTC